MDRSRCLFRRHILSKLLDFLFCSPDRLSTRRRHGSLYRFLRHSGDRIFGAEKLGEYLFIPKEDRAGNPISVALFFIFQK